MSPADELAEALERQRERLLTGDNCGIVDRDELTEVLLRHSLCPVHRCDYAICFDDCDPECAQVRMIHPGHDT